MKERASRDRDFFFLRRKFCSNLGPTWTLYSASTTKFMNTTLHAGEERKENSNFRTVSPGWYKPGKPGSNSRKRTN